MLEFVRWTRSFIRRFVLRLRLLFVKKNMEKDYRSLLVIAPHPDDEILGMGGFLCRQIRSGKRVSIVYLTDGEKSLEDLDASLVAGQRRALASAVHKRLGLVSEQAVWCGFSDGSIPRENMPEFDHAVECLQQVIRKISPESVFVTHPMDTWPYDHVAAAEIALEAVRKGSIECDVYGYWVWLWYSMPLSGILHIEWKKSCRIPIRDVLAEKKLLMDLYLSPSAPDGRPWSGVLPAAMTDAFRYPYEIVTRL